MRGSEILKITLDTNCLIDIAEERPGATNLQALYGKHLVNELDLAVVGITASENQLGGDHIQEFSSFTKRLKALNLENIGVLKPVGYWGLTFWDWANWASSHDAELEINIHQVLFPNVPFLYDDYCLHLGISNTGPLDQNWRNKKCDVLSIHSHMRDKRDVFLTSDGNFHKSTKKSALIALGAKEIRKPLEIGGFGN